MTTTPFGGRLFTGGYVPDPLDKMTRILIYFLKRSKNVVPATMGL